MSHIFTINFRREVYQRELARSRARVVSLAVWLSYFGGLAVIFGLYALNFGALVRHTRMIDRIARAQRSTQTDQVDWTNEPDAIALIDRGARDGFRWCRRLEQVAVVFPANVRLKSIQFNPSAASGGSDWNRLLLVGTLQSAAGQDRMGEVTGIVSAIQRDSLMAAHFQTIRLTSTRIAENAGSSTEFTIECRP